MTRLSISTRIAVMSGMLYIILWGMMGFLVRAGWVTIAGTVLDIPVRHWLQGGCLVVTLLATLVSSRLWVQSDGALVRRLARKWASTVAEKNRVIARTHKELEILVKDLSTLYMIGQSVNSTIDQDELFQNICHHLPCQIGIQEFAILLLDPEQQRLNVNAAWGFPHLERIRAMSFEVGEGVTGLVAQSGRMIYISNVREDLRYMHYRGEHRRTGSFLSVPLNYKGELIGVMNCGRTKIDGFSKNEIKLLQLVANQIALSIANARLYAKTRELSVRDELTGLYNRRHFLHVLQLEWKRASRFHHPLSLLMLDVDHFKKYNDTYGHKEGDRVLKQMGHLLMKTLREVDTLARFGGEEFVVVLPDTDRNGALAVGEKLRRIVESEKFTLTDQNPIPVTMSVGVANYPDDVIMLEDLIDHADMALYDAKDQGRNRVVAYPMHPKPVAEESEPAATAKPTGTTPRTIN
jgi:diguanylate cyclase (GGDEF)-like protein